MELPPTPLVSTRSVDGDAKLHLATRRGIRLLQHSFWLDLFPRLPNFPCDCARVDHRPSTSLPEENSRATAMI